VRRLYAVFTLSALVALPLAGCGSNSGSSGSPPPAAASSAAPNAGTGGSASPAASNVVGSVQMKSGKPTGGVKRISIKAGQPAVLMITSDAATQVHVHGADRLVSVPANQPTSVDVSEAAPGSYEVEDHSSDALLVQLRVS
jgi:hypothetical protein